VQGNVLYAKEKYDATQLVIDILESEAPASSSGNR
jgi:hypothetical protein